MKKRKNNTEEKVQQPSTSSYRVTEVSVRELLITVPEGADVRDVYRRDFITLNDIFDTLAAYVRKDMVNTHERSEAGAYLRRLLKACESRTVQEPVLDEIKHGA